MSTEVLLTISKTWRKPRCLLIEEFVIVFQLLRSVQLFAAPWTAASQAFLSFTIFKSLLKLMSIESVMPYNHLILCYPLLLLPSIFPSITVFSSESALSIRWPKYWSFSFSISPSNEYSGLISFRIDQFDPLAVQGTLKRFFQHHTSKASILWCSVLFMVQLSHQPTLVLLPGKCHGQRSLVGYRPWYRKESDTTERLTHSLTLISIHDY